MSECNDHREIRSFFYGCRCPLNYANSKMCFADSSLPFFIPSHFFLYIQFGCGWMMCDLVCAHLRYECAVSSEPVLLVHCCTCWIISELTVVNKTVVRTSVCVSLTSGRFLLPHRETIRIDFQEIINRRDTDAEGFSWNFSIFHLMSSGPKLPIRFRFWCGVAHLIQSSIVNPSFIGLLYEF